MIAGRRIYRRLRSSIRNEARQNAKEQGLGRQARRAAVYLATRKIGKIRNATLLLVTAHRREYVARLAAAKAAAQRNI